MIEMERIGVVSNNIAKRMDHNWGSVKSKILLDDQYHGGLHGLQEFSYAIIITYLHEANFEREKHLLRRPRNLQEMPEVGIFSQRAKNRPNSIGITTVKVVTVTDSYLEVIGLDAITDTPVLDIKPYYPQYDKKDECRVPHWVTELMENYF